MIVKDMQREKKSYVAVLSAKGFDENWSFDFFGLISSPKGSNLTSESHCFFSVCLDNLGFGDRIALF